MEGFLYLLQLKNMERKQIKKIRDKPELKVSIFGCKGPPFRSPTITYKMQDSGHSCMTYSLCEPFWNLIADCRSGITRYISSLHFTASLAACTGNPHLMIPRDGIQNARQWPLFPDLQSV